MSPRQAIILAAGEGRRLAPITDTLPKPLVPFFGRPLLDWALSAALRAGVTRIAVNAFHLADQIEAHLDQRRLTISRRWPRTELHLSREPALLGTGGAVHHLRDWLTPGEPFFVINADAVFAEPLSTLASFAAPALLVTREPAFRHERRLVAADHLVALSAQGQPGVAMPLASLDESSPEAGYTFCGVTLADPDLPHRLPSGPSCLLRQGFLPYLAAPIAGRRSRPSERNPRAADAALQVRLVETTGFFADTGTPDLLVDAHRRGFAMTTHGPPLD